MLLSVTYRDRCLVVVAVGHAQKHTDDSSESARRAQPRKERRLH